MIPVKTATTGFPASRAQSSSVSAIASLFSSRRRKQGHHGAVHCLVGKCLRHGLTQGRQGHALAAVQVKVGAQVHRVQVQRNSCVRQDPAQGRGVAQDRQSPAARQRLAAGDLGNVHRAPHWWAPG